MEALVNVVQTVILHVVSYVVQKVIKDVKEGGVARSQAVVGLAYRQIVNEIRNGGLTAAELATIVGVRERQVQHWSSGGHKPQGEARDRLLEVAYVVDQLKQVYLPEGVEIWLHGRNRELEGERPIDLLRAGTFKPVLEAIERLKVGAM